MARRLLAALTLCLAATAAAATPQLCEEAGARAAAATGVPYPVLRAIALTETGRRRGGRLQPWPWTVNMEGAGRWFDDRDAALAYVRKHHARGARSYDVGCHQINYRWHGQAFPSVEAMFAPDRNALYAARFLAALYRETGSWSRAAGAYHSRTPKYANRYRKRFDRILARLTGGAAPAAPPQQPPRPPQPAARVARLPATGLLSVGPPAAARRGSLVALERMPHRQPLLSTPRGPLYGRGPRR